MVRVGDFPVSASAQEPAGKIGLVICRGFAGMNVVVVVRAAWPVWIRSGEVASLREDELSSFDLVREARSKIAWEFGGVLEVEGDF